ncbi:MAG TPA: endonuclease/exonuclease/phosphatase family protein [Gaiellales bacterium]|nr:endonuclease/exonuclease/phosphatase family protein [Gaiellales bacterium]
MSEPVRLLIRTWNIAHGRDVPPDRQHAHVRRKLLGEMAALMVEDAPSVILLQEAPVWAGSLLREATGMGITLAPAYGAHVPFLHVPLPLAVGAAVGRALPDLVRTQVEGQANAVLYGPDLLLVSARRVQINRHQRFRGEPRIAQLVRLRHRRTGREFVLANLHAGTSDNQQQLERAGWVLEQFARGAPMVLAGDLNATARSPGMRSLSARGWFEDPEELGKRIDHILVRGMREETRPTPWPPERRDLAMPGGMPVRLSDHDPIDSVVLL